MTAPAPAGNAQAPAGAQPPTGQETPPASPPGGPSPVSLVFAALILIGYAILVGYMLEHADATVDTHWARRHGIFSGVEALALAAAGFVFGREVNRQRAEEASQRASENAKRATDAEKATKDAENRAARARADAAAVQREIDLARRSAETLASAVKAVKDHDPALVARESSDLTARLLRAIVLAETLFPDA
jgi:hypothetical protein